MHANTAERSSGSCLLLSSCEETKNGGRPRGIHTYVLKEMLSLRSGASIRIRTTTIGMKQGLITFPDTSSGHLATPLLGWRDRGLCSREDLDKQNRGSRFTSRMPHVNRPGRRRCCRRRRVRCALTNSVATRSAGLVRLSGLSIFRLDLRTKDELDDHTDCRVGIELFVLRLYALG